MLPPKRVGIYSAIVIAIALTSALLLRPSTEVATNKAKRINTSGFNYATLTGVLKLYICGGTQENFPDPKPCEESVANNTTIDITHDGHIMAETNTDTSGHYSFKVKPGIYKLIVQGESASNGHDVNLQAGPNKLDISASLQTP